MILDWKFEKINGHPLYSYKKTVQSLIKNECCNHDQGDCKILDDGETHKCPQLTSENLCCGWFQDAVLPLDKALEQGIQGGEEIKKKCNECGKPYIPKNNKQKYCMKCIPKVIKKQNSLRQQKRRLMSRNRSTL